MYTPHYLAWLDHVESHPDGWPKFVDPEACRWAEKRVKEILQQAKESLPLRVVADRLLRDPHPSELPESLRKIALWDAIFGVTHRALLGADMHPVWSADNRW